MEIELLNNLFFAEGEDEEFKCSQCRKDIDEGFICEDNKKLIFCNDCGRAYDMRRCKHDLMGEHCHIKFRRSIIQKQE